MKTFSFNEKMNTSKSYILRLATFGIIILCSFNINGQSTANDNYNFRDFKGKDYYFGLSIGANNSGYIINQSKFFIGNEEFRIAEPSSGVGGNLNFIANIKLGQTFDFRFLPGFAFTDRKLEFTQTATDEMQTVTSESVFFELPFQVRYKSAPYKDKRFYMLAGLKYGYDVAGNSDSKKEELKYSAHDFQWEVGMGVQFFYPYFIFSPEIKFSRGITNNLIYDNTLTEAKVLENVFSQIFTISLNFEG